MAQLGSEPRFTRKLRELQAYLGVLRTSERPTLDTLAPRLADVLDVQKIATYACDEVDGRVRLGRASQIGLDGLLEATDQFLAGRPALGWTGYNPLRPAPFDRGRVRRGEELVARYGAPPIVRLVFPRFGIASDHTLRVVVCERASMLAYVGLWQSSSFEARQIDTLRRLVPQLRRRLTLDRTLGAAPRTRSALLAALESIAAPAWVVSAAGAIEHANAAGRGALERDRAATHERLRAARRGEPVAGLEATPLRGNGEADAFLIVERLTTTAGSPAARVRAQIARLELTPRLAQAYELVARGLSNRTIAAEMSLSEATVVQYVTALLDKAGVESRAALIAQLLWGGE